MTDIDPWEMDEDDPEAPWNKDPVEGMPDVIVPGPIAIEFWKIGFQDEHVVYDFFFTWGGGQEAEWSWDISISNPGMSVMSSAPFYGTAKWADGSDDVEITYSAAEFGEQGEETLGNAAPDSAALDKPQTWVDLAERIADYCDGLIE